MPRNPVINRRNARPLRPRTVPLSDQAVEVLQQRAAELHVSQGSLVDTMLQELARMPDQMLIDLMRAHGMLTEDEYGLVLDVVEKNKTKKKDADRSPSTGAQQTQAGTSPAKQDRPEGPKEK